MNYVVTVNFWSGHSFTITCRWLEATVLLIEQVYGDSVESWSARGAK